MHPIEEEGWRGLWSILSDRVQHFVCLAALLLISFGFFAPIHFSGRSLFATDIMQFRSMADPVIQAGEETGHTPLWMPNAFGGMPAYTVSYSPRIWQIDTIITQLRKAIWPSSHFILLLIGTYLLIVFLTKNKWAGVLAAAAYGLTTYLPVLLATGHNTKFLALCYGPWLMLAFVYVLKKPSLLSTLFFAITLAVNLRANHVQITYYFTFTIVVWWIVEVFVAVRKGHFRPLVVSTVWLVVGSILALLMVAQPYLTIFEYKAYTIRGAAAGGEATGGLEWQYAMAWSQGIGETVTLLIADAFGGGGSTYWGPKGFTAGPHHVGGVVIMLALLAIWKYRRNVVLGLGIAAMLMILFSFGEYFPLLNRLMFDYFPLFDAFRVPETWLSVVAFTLAVLAGLGSAYIVRKEKSLDEEKEKTKAVYVVVGGMIGLVILLLVSKNVFFSFERANEYEQLIQQVIVQQPDLSPDNPQVQSFVREQIATWKAERADTFSSDAVRTLVFLLLAGLILVAYRKDKLPSWAMQAVLALLVVIDLWGVDRRYFNTDILVRSERIEETIPTYNFDQYVIDRQQAAGGMGHFRVLSLEQNDPTSWARPSYHFESLGGYSAAKLRLYQDYIDQVLFTGSGQPNENALDLLNTRFVIARNQLPGTDIVYQDEQTGFMVLENPDVVPRAFFVGETEIISSAQETWQLLRSDRFDPYRTAILPEPLALETTPLDSLTIASAHLVRYTPDVIVWNVRTDAPRLLVLSEIYYPAGWTATLDDVPVPIHRADYLLRSVFVPEGDFTLTMRFEPRKHLLGIWVAGVTTVLVYLTTFLFLGFMWQQQKKGMENSDKMLENRKV